MPVVFQHLDSVRVQIEAHKRNDVKWITYLDYDIFVRDLQQKRDQFLKTYQRHSWLSFNFQDVSAYNELSKQQFTLNR